MLGCESAVASLGPISTTPLGSVMLALVAPLKVSVKLSAGSPERSSVIGTSTVLAVSPGAKVSVPAVAV